MFQCSCCENPTVTLVRDVLTADGGRRESHKCLTCQTDHVLTYSKDSELQEHETFVR